MNDDEYTLIDYAEDMEDSGIDVEEHLRAVGELEPAYLWDVANDMRALEENRELSKTQRLIRYKEIRKRLEKQLAASEGRELPEGFDDD